MSELFSPSPPADAPDPLQGFVRRKLLGTLLSILFLLTVVVLVSIYYRQELELFTAWTFERVGLPGLLGLLFLSDAVFSPIPPDLILLLISKSDYHSVWPTLITAIGFLSTIAGYVGYFLGRKVAHTRLSALLFRRFKQTSAAVIHRFGPWGVALGAVTPMPFSLTCWTAGMLEIPFRRIAWACLLRVPRFVLYYAAIAHAESVFRFLF